MAKRIFYGWYIVAICFLCLLIISGLGLLSFPVFVKPLEAEFHWPRTWLMGGIGVAAVAAGIFQPIFGHLIDKVGVRRVMLFGVFLSGASFFLISGMHSLFTWYASVLLMGLGVVSATYVPVASLITHWFFRRRGLAMSIAMGGMGAGGFLVPNIANWLVTNPGWRVAYRLFGFVTLLFLLPLVILFIRSFPTDIGLNALGETPAGVPGERIETAAAVKRRGDSTAREALGTSNFWAIGMADLFNAFAVAGLGAQLVALAIDAGISAGVAAFAYSSINAAAFAGILAVGAAADRYNHRMMITLSYAVPGGAVLFLFDLHSSIPLFLFAAFTGFAAAGRVTLWPLVVNEVFGKKAYATVMGLLIIFYTAGIALAPPVTGYIFDRTGAYRWILIVAMVALLLSALLIAAGARRRREKASE